MVVLDTSALIYWTLDPGKLSPPAAAAIGTADVLLVSSISIWEIGIKVSRGRLELPLSVRQYDERLRSVARVTIVPVDDLLWLDNLELDWTHRDPADRTVVALAKRSGCPLVTSDAAIANFYRPCIW